jgi:hypothetical protein
MTIDFKTSKWRSIISLSSHCIPLQYSFCYVLFNVSTKCEAARSTDTLNLKIWVVKVEPVYEGVSKSFRTGRLAREQQMVELSAIRCSCIAILWVILMSFAAITLCVASQQVFVFVVVYFVIDSVRKLLDTPSYILHFPCSRFRIINIKLPDL